MSKKVSPDGGWVIICGPSIRDLMPGADPYNHETYIAEINGHYIFAAFEQTCLPKVTEGLIADLSLPEAQTICRHLLGRWVVFLTPKLGIKPKQSAVLTYFTDAHGEISGSHNFAFAGNLLGGAPTQGHRRARKEIPLH